MKTEKYKAKVMFQHSSGVIPVDGDVELTEKESRELGAMGLINYEVKPDKAKKTESKKVGD